MRIALYVHGRGRGHASRSRSVAHALRAEGHALRILAGGDAVDMLRDDPDWQQRQPVVPGSVLSTTPGRLREELALLREWSPELVISDGDMPSVLAARALRVPALAIGHDLIFSRCVLPGDTPRAALLRERVNSAHTRLARFGVAVNFLPLDAANDRVRVARPDLREALRGETRDEGHIVAYFRDPNGAPVLEALVRAGERVKLFGARFEPPPGVEPQPFDDRAFAEALLGARAVVGSSGSNLLAECVALGKPLLALYAKGDAEQRINGHLLEAAQVGTSARFDAPMAPVVSRFLARVEARDFARASLDAMPTASEAIVQLLSQVLGR